MSDDPKDQHFSRWLRVTAILMLVFCLVVAAILAYYSATVACTGKDGSECVFWRAGASCDGVPCSRIAIDIVHAGGTAADGAIAAMLCSGVVNPQSLGLGGGFLLTYYNKTEGRAYTLNAREMAPAAAHRDMFQGNGELSSTGGLAVAVPGQVRGYYALYQRFGGGVPWADLFTPSIHLCETGILVSRSLAKNLQFNREQILNEPSLSMLLNPVSQDVLLEGETLYLPQLAATFRTLQGEPDALYTGSIAEGIVEDLQTLGGIITMEDLANYKAVWSEPVQVSLETLNATFYSVPLPGSGAILGAILNVLDEYKINRSFLDDGNKVLTYQRIVETFKHVYALRTHLGDDDSQNMTELITSMTSEAYAKGIRAKILENTTSQDPRYYGAYTEAVEDHGTSHISMIAANGDAVSATSTINTPFGAMIASESTGVIFNNEMDDFGSPNITNFFGIPPSPANFIKPGKAET